MANLDPVEKIHELMQAVHSTDSCFEIWRLLTFKNTDFDASPHVRAFGSYRHFFIPSVHAHWIAFVMAVYRLYDQSGDISLISSSELRLKLTADQNETFRRKLGSIRNLADRVSALRNNLFGHRGDISAQAAFDNAKLTRTELRGLIDTSRELVEMLRAAWDLPVESWPQNDAVQDTARLLDKLGAI